MGGFFQNYFVGEVFNKWKGVMKFSEICNLGPPTVWWQRVNELFC